MSASPSCRCCGSTDVALRGRKPGAFIRREFEFHACRACGFMFVEPFSGFAIYDEAYYRGAGPDLNSAKWLLHSGAPRDAVRGVVKLGNKIVVRSDMTDFAAKAEAAA